MKQLAEACVHEAGHAVLAMLAGYDVVGLEVKKNERGDGYEGVCSAVVDDEEFSDKALIGAYCMAGLAAERINKPYQSRFLLIMTGGHGDCEDFKNRKCEGSVEEAERRARLLLLPYWDVVYGLATILEQDKSVSLLYLRHIMMEFTLFLLMSSKSGEGKSA